MSGLFWICLITFFYEISFQIGRPMVSLLLLEMGASPGTIGAVLSIGGLAALALGIPLGRLADRIGPRRMMTFGSIVTASTYLLLWQARSIWEVAVAQSLSTAGITACIIAIQILVASAGSEGQREQNFGWFSTAVAFSQMVGPPIGGVLADGFGISTVFLGSTVAGLVPLIAQWLLPMAEPGPSSGKTVSGGQGQRPGGLHLLTRPDLRYLMVVALLIMLAFDIRVSFFPIYLDQLGYSKSQIGLFFTVLALAGLGVRPQVGRLSAWLGHWRLLTAALAVATPAFFLLPFTSHVVWLAVACAGLGLSFGVTQPLTMAMTASAALPAERGFALGFRLTSQRLGNVISPFVLGIAASLAGVTATFFGAGVVILAGVAVSAAGARTDLVRRTSGKGTSYSL